jgi:virulence-associated protein VagC
MATAKPFKNGRSQAVRLPSHALALRAVLVTRDAVFRDIPGLVCEDWTRL